MEMNMTNLLWFFAFIFLAGGNGFGGLFGNNRGAMPMPPVATQTDVYQGLQNQSVMNELNALGLATANNNYETARLIQDQNLLMQGQNNTNLINVIQGFNNVMLQMQNQNAQLSSKMDGLSAQMSSCCCEIKTMNLQHWYEEAQAKVVALENAKNNADQTQILLNTMGKWVASAPATAGA